MLTLRNHLLLVVVLSAAACADSSASAVPTPARLPVAVLEASPGKSVVPVPDNNQPARDTRPAEAQEYARVQGVAAGDVLNVRASPSSTSNVLASIPPDAVDIAVLEVSVTQPAWRRVRYHEVEGWVNGRFLKTSTAVVVRTESVRPHEPVVCFGTEPFWRIDVAADGSVRCLETCDGPAGLRLARVESRPADKVELLSIATSEGAPFMQLRLKRTGRCSDGMSDERYPYKLEASGKPGDLKGCCRVAK